MTIYCDNNNINSIKEFVTSNIQRLEEFSVKKLIENPEKSKITAKFEYHRKKVFKNIYNELCEICSSDSITIQEYND